MERLRGFEDLEVFQRAYRISLEVHRKSLEFPAIEQRALAGQIRRASKSICANLVERVWPAGLVEIGVPSLLDDGDGFGRRDAGMDALLPRSRLHRH
jgi:hypothetical protein